MNFKMYLFNGKGGQTGSGMLRKALFILLFIFTISTNESYGTHASGSDLTYTWVSGNTFRVTVSFYRDCAGVAAPNTITLNARSASCNRDQSFTLSKTSGTGQEITFPCRTVNTKCTSGSSVYAGYQQYVYSANVTLPQQCTDWVLSYYVCCRNCAITTLNNPCNDNMYVEATLNNVVAPQNSSPKFTNIPVAFLCINQSFTYNHGVIDPNGDSLVYSFITPKTYNTGNNSVGSVTFNPGYSASSPLSSLPAVNINSSNGDITMFPTSNNEVGVAAILVREYRNGVLIGSVIRDMQFLTKSCNPNLLPSASGINGTGVFSAVVCPGTPISFSVNSSDPNAADTIVMNWNDVIPGATFTTVGAQTPVGTFSWTPTLADARSQPYSFIITVRDNACPTNGSQTFSYSIYVPKVTATISSPGLNGFNVACFGGATGTATVVPSGGTAPYTYSWSPSGQTNATATGLNANTYTVTVSDANGCPFPVSIALNQPPDSITTSISSSTNVSCNGGANGTALASASGGFGSYSYSWSPSGQTVAAATGLAAGNYSVTITDDNGCTGRSFVSITQPSALTASIASFTNVTCNGNANGSISVSEAGGSGPYTHSWSNGMSGSSITGLGPGTYTDTVRDANGCQTLISQLITEPGGAVGIPASAISSSNVLCFGGTDGTASVSPSGGTLPYTISWSNGDSGNLADSLSAGVYTVSIVDGNGCTFDSSIIITEPPLLNSQFINFSTTPAGTNITCNGDADGEVNVSVFGGAPPFTYLWSDGSVIDSISGKTAGTYWVVITDDNGCTHSDTTTLTEPALFSNTLTKQDVVCKGESSGWIKTNVSGGAPAFSYLWTPLLQTSDSIGGLATGFYGVTITDINGCVINDTITISEPDTLVPLITAITFFGDVNVRCNGDSSAVVSVQVTGGTMPYTYQWNNGETNDTLFNLPAGTVSVYVRDVNGCSITGARTLTEPAPFQYSTVISHPKCYDDSSGYVVLNVSGSVGPYTYNWSNGASADSAGNLPAGTISTIISDANLCEDSVGFILSYPDSISSPAVLSDYLGFNVSCNGGSDGYIALDVSGGTPPYSYNWSTGAATDSVSGLVAGNYNVTITDDNGCEKDTGIVLTEPTVLNLTVTADVYSGGFNVSCMGYNDGVARAVVSGGTPPYTYLWSNGNATDTAVGLDAGTHSLAVTDSNGCVITENVVLIEPVTFSLSASLSDFNGFNVPCYGDSAGCISVTITGGASPFTYMWNIEDSVNLPSVCNLPADTIGLRVQDANGCTLDSAFILTAPQPISLSASLSQYNGFNVQCYGSDNGSINLAVNGGLSPFIYLWSTGDTTEDIAFLTAGTYQVEVTDTNGCIDTASFTLTEPPQIQNNIYASSSACGVSNGTAWVVPTSGLPPFTYLWISTASLNDTAGSLAPGWQHVIITDSVGCSHQDSILISAIPPMLISVSSQTNNECFGRTTGSATVAVNNGTAPFTYSWSNGDVTDTADSLAAGTYVVTVTDSSGCIDSLSIIITESLLIQANSASTPATCSYINDGSASITVSGGTPPITVSWSNGDTGLSSDSLAGGYATYVIVDSNSCSLIDSVMIIQPSPVTASLTTLANVSCFGDANGSASVNLPSGGTAPYTLLWSTGDTGPFIDSLTAGTYSLIITDANSCTLSLNTVISQPAASLNANINSVDATCFGFTDGSAIAIGNGGTSPYNYLWNPGASTTASITSLGAGTYTVVITDALACTYTGTVIISQPAVIPADAGQNYSGCENELGLSAVLSGSLTGIWSVSTGSASIADVNSPTTQVSQLAEGDNVLIWTVTDGTCSGQDSVVIHVHEPGECELELPNAFSPNGDGYNDGYFIQGIARFPSNTMTVFNRWGNEVFSVENYKNSQWYGQNKNGDELPEGTYFVVLEIPDWGIKRNTFVELRRSSSR